jgi:very-short-patch-repair endonuclease
LAARQFGLITRQQLRDLDVAPRTISYRAAAGHLRTIHPGVYTVPGAPSSWEQSVMAALLACGEHSAVCGPSAARLWKFDRFAAVKSVCVLVPYTCGTSPRGVTVQRTRSLLSRDVVRHGNLRVTTVERTLVDLAGIMGFEALEDVLDEALRRSFTSITKLARRVALAGQGVRGIANLRRLLRARTGVRPRGSTLESRFFRRLRRAGVRLPISQFELRDEDGLFVGFLDFAYPDEMLAIEIDGSGHLSRKVRERDLVRQNKIVLEDWRILRFTDTRVDFDPTVPLEIERALARSVSENGSSAAKNTHRTVGHAKPTVGPAGRTARPARS